MDKTFRMSLCGWFKLWVVEAVGIVAGAEAEAEAEGEGEALEIVTAVQTAFPLVEHDDISQLIPM